MAIILFWWKLSVFQFQDHVAAQDMFGDLHDNESTIAPDDRILASP